MCVCINNIVALYTHLSTIIAYHTNFILYYNGELYTLKGNMMIYDESLVLLCFCSSRHADDNKIIGCKQ